MKKILLAALLLAGCEQAAGPDGYRFERAEFTRTNVALTVVIHPSLADLQRSIPTANAPDPSQRKLMAWSKLGVTNPTCELHMVDPAKDYEPTWVGHEVYHCVYGRFHG